MTKDEEKKIYEQILIFNLGRFPFVYDAENENIRDFSIEISNKVTDIYKSALIELEKF